MTNCHVLNRKYKDKSELYLTHIFKCQFVLYTVSDQQILLQPSIIFVLF